MDYPADIELQRTAKQNRALHKYFALIAETLNDAGLDMKAALKPEVDIPWGAETVKEYLWRPVQRYQLRKGSTTELSTRQINEIHEMLNRFLGEKFGISVPFPNQDA